MMEAERITDPYPPTLGELARLILQAQAAGEPIVLSINGRGQLPVADPESIQQLYELVDQFESIEVVRRGVRSFEQGAQGHDLDEVYRSLRAKHGLPL